MRPPHRAGICRCPAMDSAPHFLFNLVEKKTGRTRKGYAASVRRQSRQRLRDCTVQKKRPLFCRAPAPLCLRADRGLPNRCRRDLPAFCRLAPGRSFALVSSREFGGAVVGVKNRMVPAPEPAAAGREVDGGLCKGR